MSVGRATARDAFQKKRFLLVRVGDGTASSLLCRFVIRTIQFNRR